MRGSRIVLAAGVTLLLLLLITPASAFLTGYGYCQDVTVNNTGSNLTDYQVSFTVNTSSGTSSGSTIYLNSHSESDLDDLRFTSTSDTVYDYWIESTSNPYLVWVEVPSILNSTVYGTTTLRVQYGNSSSSAYSNGTNTFPIFDDFLGTTLDTGKWDNVTAGSGGTITVSGGSLNLNTVDRTTAGENDIGISSKSYTPDTATIMRVRANATTFSGATASPPDSSLRFAVNNLYRHCFGGQPSTYIRQYVHEGVAWDASATESGLSLNTFYAFETRTDSLHDIYGRRDTGSWTSFARSTSPSTWKVYCIAAAYRGVSGTSDANVSVDWICTRKYSAIEPGMVSWSGETSTAGLIAAFSANVTSGYPPFFVQFTDSSANSPTTWNWTFEDGGYSSDRNATHWYNTTIGNSATSYDVKLYANNTVGGDWENKTDYITTYPLQAGFSANVTTGDAPLVVQFTDTTSNGTATSWWWDFNDDGIVDDINQSPVYTFTTGGLHTIRLNSSNSYSYDWENKTDYIGLSDWLDGYCYRQIHNLTGSSTWASNQLNYTVLFVVNRTSASASSGQYLNLSSRAQSNLTDLRFADFTGDTLYDYWIESNTNTDSLYNVWVEIPSITNSTTPTRVYIYYGNASVSSLSNGNTTFTFFDDFPGTTLDATKWTNDWSYGSGGTISVSGGILSINSTNTASGKAIKSATTFSAPYAMHQRVKFSVLSSLYDSLFACSYISGNTNPTAIAQIVNGFTIGYDTYNEFTANEGDGSNRDSEELSTSLYYPFDYNTFVSYRNNTGYVDQYFNSSVVDNDHTYAYTSPTIMRYGTYHCADTKYVYSDWIFVRKYDTIEPSHSDWAAEESECCISSPAFSANVTNGYAPLVALFTDSSSPDPDDWYWIFGDGDTSTDQNPTHTYDSVIGNTATQYTVSLNISNASCGFGWENKTNYITVYPLQAGFSANKTIIVENGYVSFTDSTINGTATTWDWDWGDGTAHGNTQNPTHQYTTNGTFTVRLNSSNSYSYDWENKTSYIRVLPSINSYDGITWEYINSTPSTRHDTYIPTDFLELYIGELAFTTNNSRLVTMNITNGVLNESVRTATGSGYTSAHIIDGKFVILDENSPSLSYSYLYNTTDFITWTQWVKTSKNIGQGFAIGTDGLMYMSGTTMSQSRITRDDTTIWTGGVLSGDDAMGAICLNGVYVAQDAYPTGPIYSTDMSTWVDMWTPAVSGFPDGYNATFQFDWAMTPIVYDEYNILIPSQAVNWAEHTAGFATFNTSTKEYLSYNLSKQLIGATVHPDLIGGSDGTPTSYGVSPTTDSVIYRYTMSGTLGNKTMDWINGTVAQMYYNKTNSPYIWAIVGDADAEFVHIIRGTISLNADFTSNVTEGYLPFAVEFTDDTEGDPTAWDWYFPNGGDSHTEDATWTFDYNIGNTITTYNISLNASNSAEYNWENKTSYITAYPLNASFSYNISTGCNPLTVQFTDLTDNGTATAWNWSFDDGTYSEDQNPVHTFTAEDTFTVTLNASNVYSWDIEEKTDAIVVSGSSPVAGFTGNVTAGYPSFPVAFTDASSNSPTNWDWYVEDSKVSDDQNPTILFNYVIGSTITSYDVNLFVSNACGSDWENATANITAYPLNASFTANITTGDASLPVAFGDLTDNGTATTWWWDFNEDGSVDDTNQSPTFVYSTPGVYNVSLNASNAYSFGWLNLTDYITVTTPPAPPPVAGFSANVTSGYPNFSVLFTDTTTEGPTDWDWYIDGIKSSDDQNFLYSFDDVIGNTIVQYDIGLYVVAPGGTDWENKTNYITAYPLNASFSANVTTDVVNFPVAFTDLTDNGTATTWWWDFNDDGVCDSTAQSPTYTFVSTGYQTIKLNVSNAYSFDWENKTNYIYGECESPLTSGFSANVTAGYPAFSVQFTDASTFTETNNVDNGDFEVGTTAGWDRSSYMLVNASTDKKHSGSYSLMVWAFLDPSLEDTYAKQDVDLTDVDKITFWQYSTISNSSFWIDDTYEYQMYNTSAVWVYHEIDTSAYSGIHTIKFNESNELRKTYFDDITINSTNTYYWNFGDGETSTDRNATHTYDSVIGNTVTPYTVSLNVSNRCEYDWENKTNYVTAYPLNASFSGTPTIGNSPLAVVFTDLSDNGTVSSWSWDFGDTHTSIVQNPGNTYNGDNLYTVLLNVSNAFSWDIEEKIGYINVTANYTPTATPTPTTTSSVAMSPNSVVSVHAATGGSGLIYPLIILGFGGIGIVAVVGLVVFGRRRRNENDW